MHTSLLTSAVLVFAALGFGGCRTSHSVPPAPPKLSANSVELEAGFAYQVASSLTQPLAQSVLITPVGLRCARRGIYFDVAVLTNTGAEPRDWRVLLFPLTLERAQTKEAIQLRDKTGDDGDMSVVLLPPVIDMTDYVGGNPYFIFAPSGPYVDNRDRIVTPSVTESGDQRVWLYTIAMQTARQLQIGDVCEVRLNALWFATECQRRFGSSDCVINDQWTRLVVR